ncbi:MAG: SbcC/MukB-like Walker B domain-containing protein [Pseudoclavibacter sp.]
MQRSITRIQLASVGQQVSLKLRRERDKQLEAARQADNQVTQLATAFKERWPAAAADLTGGVGDREALVDMLDDIVAHGLPDHEQNFRRLLRDRSRDLIGGLVSEILDAPGLVSERVLPVNDALRRSPFDEGRYLHLRVKTQRSEAAKTFIKDLQSVTEGSWGDQDEESIERRYKTLERIMHMFASSERKDQLLRRQCLDTRLHVTFRAEEVDEDGRVQDSYESGAAMSGGQQQKLVVFCLAAALRYQLADVDQPWPTYGTIIMDEAFDKADTRYTRMALGVFVAFGFHLVLATPQKLLPTIEAYVGGVTNIENPERNASTVANVDWEKA